MATQRAAWLGHPVAVDTPALSLPIQRVLAACTRAPTLLNPAPRDNLFGFVDLLRSRVTGPLMIITDVLISWICDTVHVFISP